MKLDKITVLTVAPTCTLTSKMVPGIGDSTFTAPPDTAGAGAAAGAVTQKTLFSNSGCK